MNTEKDGPLNLETIDLDEESSEELKELSQEEEAIKVLSRISNGCGLGDEEDLIRFIYTQAVSAHESESLDVATMGRTIHEMIRSEFQQQGDEES